jgi:hypothetical protein
MGATRGSGGWYRDFVGEHVHTSVDMAPVREKVESRAGEQQKKKDGPLP